MNATSGTARRTFTPGRPAAPAPLPPPLWPLRPRTYLRFLLDFYRDPVAWIGVAVSALILVYAGGAVMFFLHSVYLGEGGPAIHPAAHWALDSTAGLIGLTPAVALVVPLAAWVATRADGWFRPEVYAVVAGAMFAVATAPGPPMHDLLVGRGTWVADHVTALVGSSGVPAAPPVDIPAVESIAWQVGVGLPTYAILVWLSLVLARGLLGLAGRRQPVIG